MEWWEERLLIEGLERDAREANGDGGSGNSYETDYGDRHEVLTSTGEELGNLERSMIPGESGPPKTAEQERKSLAGLGVSVGTF